MIKESKIYYKFRNTSDIAGQKLFQNFIFAYDTNKTSSAVCLYKLFSIKYQSIIINRNDTYFLLLFQKITSSFLVMLIRRSYMIKGISIIIDSAVRIKIEVTLLSANLPLVIYYSVGTMSLINLILECAFLFILNRAKFQSISKKSFETETRTSNVQSI